MTWTDARLAVAQVAAPLWKDAPGTFYVDPEGYEDARAWWVIVGNREWLEGGDPEWALMDPPVYLVDKATGEVTTTTYLEDAERLDRMTPC